MAFKDDIEAEMLWRFNELNLLKNQIQIHTKPNTPTRNSLLRAAWPILYAHYEGFCKRSLRLYMGVIANAALKTEDARIELIRFSLRSVMSKFCKDLKATDWFDFFRFGWRQCMTRHVDFEIEPKSSEYLLAGEANLWPDKLKENCAALGLPTDYITNNSTVLGVLVGRRNDIAHGRAAAVQGIDQYRLYEAAVMDVMTGLGISLIDAVAHQQYRRLRFDFGDLGRNEYIQILVRKHV